MVGRNEMQDKFKGVPKLDKEMCKKMGSLSCKGGVRAKNQNTEWSDKCTCSKGEIDPWHEREMYLSLLHSVICRLTNCIAYFPRFSAYIFITNCNWAYARWHCYISNEQYEQYFMTSTEYKNINT
jgi:hypothetical protein